jgi:hypothetical protein
MAMAHSRKEERHRGDQYAFIQEKGQCKTDLVPIMFDPIRDDGIARHHVELTYTEDGYIPRTRRRSREETEMVIVKRVVKRGRG